MLQVLSVYPLEKYFHPRYPLCFPQVKPQVSKYPHPSLRFPQAIHQVEILKKDKFLTVNAISCPL